MKHGGSGLLLAALFAATTLTLGASALSLPVQPFTGLVLQSGHVVRVLPGSPGDRAGLRRGDELFLAQDARDAVAPNPLATAAPGHGILLRRVGAGGEDRVWIVPAPLPSSERHMMVALLTVAAGFLLLAGLVWSERRDRLTRTFVLLCLAFSWLLAPFPRLRDSGTALAFETIYSGITLFLPALFIHFFALFPEPPRAGGFPSRLAVLGYAIAGALFAASLLPLSPLPRAFPALTGAGSIVEGLAAIWFTAGLLLALVLFGRSYLRAGTKDARRRLRVAVAGTVLGAVPLAAISLIRNLAPATELPFDRLAVLATLLVPASFAWAIAVHRVFDTRIALRVGVAAGLLALAPLAATIGADALSARVDPDAGPRVAGWLLAAVVAGAAVAGPVSLWLRGAAARFVPAAASSPLSEWAARGAAGSDDSARALLEEACRALVAALRLDGCAAIELEDGHALATAGFGLPAAPALAPALGVALAGARGPLPLDEAPLGAEDSRALERSGVSWLLPIGAGPTRAVLLLGRRIAGAWLGRLETRELERFADHLEVSLENTSLRRAALTRGALDRELRIAGELQAHRLPRRAPAYPTLDCAAAALASERVGGDYYDFIEISPRDFTLAVGDAAGKGIPAALVMAGVQSRFRTEAAGGARPGTLLGALNRELVAFDQPERFMGLLCARVDVRAGRVWFANAGLTPPMIRRRDGRFEEITAGGVLLGVSPEANYPDVCVDLGPGDVAVLYTDGLTEAQRGDELFGEARLRDVLDDCAGRRAADILDRLLLAVRQFADRPLDDVTVVVLRQIGPTASQLAGPASQFALKSARIAADA